jgi:hypothetical protein
LKSSIDTQLTVRVDDTRAAGFLVAPSSPIKTKKLMWASSIPHAKATPTFSGSTLAEYSLREIKNNYHYIFPEAVLYPCNLTSL